MMSMFSDAETTPKPFENDGFLEEGPLSPRELINTVGGLVRGVFQAFRRIAGTVRNVSSIAQSLVDKSMMDGNMYQLIQPKQNMG